MLVGLVFVIQLIINELFHQQLLIKGFQIALIDSLNLLYSEVEEGDLVLCLRNSYLLGFSSFN